MPRDRWSQRSTCGAHGGDLERRAGVSEGGGTAENGQAAFSAWRSERGSALEVCTVSKDPLSRDQWRQELQWRQDEPDGATKGSTPTNSEDLPGLLLLETSASSPPKPFGSKVLFLAAPRSGSTLKLASTS